MTSPNWCLRSALQHGLILRGALRTRSKTRLRLSSSRPNGCVVNTVNRSRTIRRCSNNALKQSFAKSTISNAWVTNFRASRACRRPCSPTRTLPIRLGKWCSCFVSPIRISTSLSSLKRKPCRRASTGASFRKRLPTSSKMRPRLLPRSRPPSWGAAISRCARREGKDVLIDVVDNGVGLPKENRSRLLEPYVTTREKGTGLGLAIVGRILEEHGGRLELRDASESTPGARGAWMQLRFSAEQIAAAAERELPIESRAAAE